MAYLNSLGIRRTVQGEYHETSSIYNPEWKYFYEFLWVYSVDNGKPVTYL